MIRRICGVARTRSGVGAACALAAILLCTAPLRAADLTVFAAASTGTVLTEIVAQWQAVRGTSATLSLAGSSALARQIAAGAPADVFVSANPGWMDDLERQGRIVADTRADLLSNTLVLIAQGPADGLAPLSEEGIEARLGTGRLAMALVDAVPAGIYGRAALEHFGLWDGVAPRVAQTDNVRAALALVALGAAPLGIVYGSDAHADPRVSVVATFPAVSHPPIVYPVAAVIGGDLPLSRDFIGFLRSDAAREAFERNGFSVIGN